MSVNFNKKLMLLHKVITHHYEDLNILLEEYLAAGCEIFEMEMGIASHVVGESYIVESVTRNSFSLERGVELSVKDTYCYYVVKNRQTIHFANAEKEVFFRNHPVYINIGLASYISAPIIIEDEVYGTLNFSSKNKRDTPFTQQDLEIVEMMAQTVGQFIEMRKHKYESETTARMALVGQMAGSIAHEINNPMAVISSNSEFIHSYLKSQGIVDKDLEESLFIVKRTINRVKDIISGLKVIMGNGDIKLEPVNLRNLIDNTMSLVWEKFKYSRIEIINDINPDVMVYASPVQLSQVILNLAQNSFDAIKNNENLWINFSCIRRGRVVELSVMDSGIGIRSDVAEQIMQPFYTTKKVGRGSGLGLSLSKSIIEHFGGELFYDHQSANTCFKLRLKDATYQMDKAL